MRCSGPYTRVYFGAKEAKPCRRLAEGLAGMGFEVAPWRAPAGDGRSEDLAVDIDLREPLPAQVLWTVRLAKFLGPRKLFGRSHVYEATLRRAGPEDVTPWQGHLFSLDLKDLADRVLKTLPLLVAGRAADSLVGRDEAHEVRIEMCND
ncbi:MAG: hypothetical protein H7841_01245 [Magnetospirillum sp. WYHS-4]